MTHMFDKPRPDNYFSLFGLPIDFNVDKQVLIDNYHQIQKTIHPDNFANASDLERRMSVQKAAQINDALESLKNPLPRAIYLLSLFDVQVNDNSTALAPTFLMEQMELREQLSQVSEQADPFAALDAIMADVAARFSASMENLSSLFAELLSAQELLVPEQRDELLNQLKPQVLAMQFLNRLQEECLNKEQELADTI